MNTTLVLLFGFLTMIYAAKKDAKGCSDLFIDKAHAQKLLEQKGFSPEALEQASYVEAELESFGRKARRPVLFVHAPGHMPEIIAASKDGGQIHVSERWTEFIHLGETRLALRVPDHWKTLAQLDQRDVGLKAFVESHATEIRDLMHRQGFRASHILKARIFGSGLGPIIGIRHHRFDHSRWDYWIDRGNGHLVSIEEIFGSPDHNSAVPLDGQLILFRLRNNDGVFEYQVAPSLESNVTPGTNPEIAKLIQKDPLLTTYLKLRPQPVNEDLIFSARVQMAKPADEADLPRSPIFVLRAPGSSDEILAIVDTRFGIATHDAHYENERAIHLDDDRVTWVIQKDGDWRYATYESEGEFGDLMDTLSVPLSAKQFEQFGAKQFISPGKPATGRRRR